jgi:hypothetical protein
MLYVAGGLLAVLSMRYFWRWWRSRVNVSPVSERWLAEKRGSHDHE